MIQELQKFEKDGWGDLEVAIMIKDKSYPPGGRGSAIESIQFGDIGGWGNYTIYINPYESLVSETQKNSKKT